MGSANYLLLNVLLAFIVRVNSESSDLSVLESTEKDASCICLAIYDPVCGSDGKTYGNACSLACTRKQNPFVFGLCKGECPCCKEPFYNDPLTFQEESGFWGWDLKTGAHHQVLLQKMQNDYGNEVLTNATDSCSKQVPNPNCFYTEQYDPVCGSDGVTYGNSGELACQSKVRPCLRQACKGACPCCPCSSTGNPTVTI